MEIVDFLKDAAKYIVYIIGGLILILIGIIINWNSQTQKQDIDIGTEDKPSDNWYLLPFLFGLPGFLLTVVRFRKRNRKMLSNYFKIMFVLPFLMNSRFIKHGYIEVFILRFLVSIIVSPTYLLFMKYFG